MIVFCCWKNVASNLFGEIQPFISVTCKNFQTFQQHFPLGKFTESNDTTFLDRRGISPGVAPPCRAGRHGGEAVGKPSLKSIGEVCPHHRKHRVQVQSSEATLCFCKKVEIMTRFR